MQFSISSRLITVHYPQVDNYEPISWTFDVKGSADAQFNNIQYVYIGKNESMAEGFVGCISRVEFDDIYPLKFYFQQDRPASIIAESSEYLYCENVLMEHKHHLREIFLEII